MLVELGHTVYLYGARSTKAEYAPEKYIQSPNFHFVETHITEDIAKTWGSGDNRFEIGYDWKVQDYKHDMSGSRSDLTKKFYKICVYEIKKTYRPDHFLLCTQGQYHKPIADELKMFLTCESGIGYRGWCEPMYHAFESSYGMNFIYGSQFPFASLNGRYYDRVIPNYFDPEDVEFSAKPGSYYLFIGRLIKRKGILTAYEACKASDVKLLIAGQGGIVKENGHLVDNHPQEFDIPPDSNWEYVGYADVNKRKDLMKNAIATFVATEYLEMFGGVNVESRLHGTPVITTDFGCFPEYVENGLDGFRCSTLRDFVDAVENVKKLDRRVVRKRAERFLMDNVAKQYQKWFDDLYNVWESSFFPGKKGWHRL